MPSQHRFHLAAALLAPLCAGCLSMEVPPEFLVLEEGTSEFKAVTPDDARLWMREFSNSQEGTLGFWSETLRHDLVENRGYTLIEEKEIQDGENRKGHSFLFEATVGGTTQRYLIAVFVIEGWLSSSIRTVEFGAPKETFARYAEAVEKAIAKLE